jgi:hypothetical protein
VPTLATEKRLRALLWVVGAAIAAAALPFAPPTERIG